MPIAEKQENGNLSASKSEKGRIILKTDKPGTTILITKLSKSIAETELRTSFGTYGSISQVFISADGFVLLEFNNISTASDVLAKCKANPLKIGSHIARLSFSSQTIDEYKSLSKPNTNRANITKVLHFLITNAVYTINIDILYKICSPHGKIVRIFIGKKNVKENSIEALIEFASDTDAKSVKDSLQGNDIYSSCCSLTLCYSKIHRIFVERNDSESFDYSIVPKAGLLGPPPTDIVPSVYPSITDNAGPSYATIPFALPPPFVAPLFHPPPLQQQPCYGPLYPSAHDKKPPFLYYAGDATVQEAMDGVVIQCRNFATQIGADNLFNLFCLYGNVEKIKLTNESSAPVAYIQMSNREGAEFCYRMLCGVCIFGRCLDLALTRLGHVSETVPGPGPVHAYYSDVNNRFKHSFQGKSRVFAPSQTLHFFNVPSQFRAEEIADVFVSAHVKDPCQVVIFPAKKSGGGGSGGRVGASLVTGLIEFDTVDEALEGIVMVNHTRLLLPTVSHPYHIKLAFSPAKILEQHIKSTTMTEPELERPSKRLADNDDSSGDAKSARSS